MNKNVYRWIPAILWGMLLAILSLMPGKQGNFFLFGIPHIDKLAHFGMYAVWAFLVFYALSSNTRLSLSGPMGLAFLIGTFAGALFEYGQYATSLGRSFEIMDMVANAAGSLAGSLGGAYFKRRNFLKKL